MPLTTTDINKKISDIVTDYISNGYVIHFPTMRFVPADTSVIDLIDPEEKEIVRIQISTNCRYAQRLSLEINVYNIEGDEAEYVCLDRLEDANILCKKYQESDSFSGVFYDEDLLKDD